MAENERNNDGYGTDNWRYGTKTALLLFVFIVFFCLALIDDTNAFGVYAVRMCPTIIRRSSSVDFSAFDAIHIKFNFLW